MLLHYIVSHFFHANQKQEERAKKPKNDNNVRKKISRQEMTVVMIWKYEDNHSCIYLKMR